jgi:hypothetical protein
MTKLPLFLALVPTALLSVVACSTSAQAQGVTVPQVAPRVRDIKAITIFGSAINAYRGLKGYSAEVFEFGTPLSEPVVYDVQWAPPGKASLLIKGLGVRPDTKSVADGKNVFRLFPRNTLFGTSEFDRVPMNNASDADAIFTASPLLMFGLRPLLAGKNLAQDGKIARGVKMGRIPLPEAADKEDKDLNATMNSSMDVVHIQAALPGETPDKRTDLIYGFDKKTHRLSGFWMQRVIAGKRQTVQLSVIEHLATPIKATDFIWKAPKGTKEVPFRGMLFTKGATSEGK